MPTDIRIALDCMGGDDGPAAVIGGAVRAHIRLPSAEFIFFGTKEVIEPLWLKCSESLRKKSNLIFTEKVISSDEKPSVAMRRGKGSSLWMAIEAVKKGEADCMVSSGNTGALTAVSVFLLRCMPGINRPAIAGLTPSLHGECCVLDLGATVDASTRTLLQHAAMGQLFARLLMGIVKPRVAYLNIGVEDIKGHEEIREAAGILQERVDKLGDQAPFEYVGFVEGDFMLKGQADVVITDGFTGNVMLKTMEGTAKIVSSFIHSAFQSDFLAKIGYIFASKAMGKLKKRTDPRGYNGAILLGLNGIVVKSHGGSDDIGFAAAIERAADLVSQDFLGKMDIDLKQMELSKVDIDSDVEIESDNN